MPFTPVQQGGAPPPALTLPQTQMPQLMAPPQQGTEMNLASALAKSGGGSSGSGSGSSSLGGQGQGSMGGSQGAPKSTANPGGLNKAATDPTLKTSETGFDTAKYGTGTVAPQDASWLDRKAEDPTKTAPDQGLGDFKPVGSNQDYFGADPGASAGAGTDTWFGMGSDSYGNDASGLGGYDDSSSNTDGGDSGGDYGGGNNYDPNNNGGGGEGDPNNE